MEDQIQAAVAVGSYREALTLIARAHSTVLLRYCYGVVGSEAEAEELLQDTLTQAFQALPRFREEGSVRAWIFGIARRVCASHLRRRDRRAGLWARFSGASAPPPPPPARPAIDVAEHNQERQLLHDALLALEPSYREAVMLRYQAGLAGPEIARCLGIRPAAARKRVSLGLAKLRVHLAPLLADAALAAESNKHTSDEESSHGPSTLRAG